VTPDGGETWVDRPEGSRRDTHALATHPDAPDRVYAAAGDGFRGEPRPGRLVAGRRPRARSRVRLGARGRSRRPGDGARERGLGSEGGAQPRRGVPLPAGIGDDGRGDGDEDRGAASDSGPLRAARRPGIPTGEGTYRAVLASGRADGTMWAVHNEGLYRTRDAGESFERVPADLPASPARALAIE